MIRIIGKGGWGVGMIRKGSETHGTGEELVVRWFVSLLAFAVNIQTMRRPCHQGFTARMNG